MKIHIKQVMVIFFSGVFILTFLFVPTAYCLSDAYKNNIYNPGILKPTDSVLKLKVGDRAPDFTLPGSDGRTYRLRDFAGRTVVLAWFPKAFTAG